MLLISDKQDTETSELVRQQQQVLKDAQARAKEKASQLESVVTDYETKLKVCYLFLMLLLLFQYLKFIVSHLLTFFSN